MTFFERIQLRRFYFKLILFFLLIQKFYKPYQTGSHILNLHQKIQELILKQCQNHQNLRKTKFLGEVLTHQKPRNTICPQERLKLYDQTHTLRGTLLKIYQRESIKQLQKKQKNMEEKWIRIEEDVKKQIKRIIKSKNSELENLLICVVILILFFFALILAPNQYSQPNR